MIKTELEKKILKLEAENKKWLEELIYIDQLMRGIGFDDGLLSLKLTAEQFKENQ
ncbi:MAG TPA: hypothetical protein PLC42_01245 [Parachlamydiaceae bacterium]|nr:hypothetical protein [Parachlamydiaceae bacterium]